MSTFYKRLTGAVALLLTLTLAAPGSARAGTAANLPPDQPQPLPVLEVPSSRLAAGLTLTVAEACGSANNDRVAVVGQECPVTVTVTSNGTPVSGARVYGGGNVYFTNAAGTVAITIPSSETEDYYIDAEYGDVNPATGWTVVELVQPGEGLLNLVLLDRHGVQLTTYTVQVMKEDSPPYWTDLSPGWKLAPLEAGTYRIALGAQSASGEGYTMEFPAITVPDGGRMTWVADGAATTPVTITASLNGTPVVNAEAFVTVLSPNSRAMPRGIKTVNGQAVIRVLGGQHEVAVMGGSPAIFAAQTVQVGDDPVSATFALTQTATLNWNPASATTITGGRVSISTGTSGRTYGWPVKSGTLAVAPGSYMLRGSVSVKVDTTTWTYDMYGLPGPGADANQLYPFVAGQTYPFTGAGPWSIDIVDAPDTLEPGGIGWFESILHSQDAELNWIGWSDSETSQYGRSYAIRIENAGGQVLASNQYRSMGWVANVPNGTYTVRATAANPGPLFAAGSSFAAHQTFQVGQAGPRVRLGSSPVGLRGVHIPPGGQFDLYASVESLPETATAVTLEILYDPAQLLFVGSDSGDGNGTLTAGTGTVTWDWTAGTDSASPEYPRLRFQAQPGFTGNAILATGTNTGASDATGPIALGATNQHMWIAANGMTLQAGTLWYLPAWAVTDGTAVVWGNELDLSNTSAMGLKGLYALDLTAAMTRALVMAPMHLPAEITVTPPASGMANAGTVVLTYGDVNANGTIDLADLNQIGAHLTQQFQDPLPYEMEFDARTDGRVDIFDLVKAARNAGATSNLTVPRGAIAFSVGNTALQETQAAIVDLTHGEGPNTILAGRQYVTLTAGATTTGQFTNLPPGTYWVHVVRQDGLTFSGKVTVAAGTSATFELNW